MIILQADNRILTTSAPYTYLESNIASGASSITVLNPRDGFAADDFILIGNIGDESAEIFRIGSVSTSTRVITLLTSAGVSTTTAFAHAESTRVTIIPYNQIRFFHTTTDTYSDSTPLAGYTDILPSDWFTTYEDETYSTGYGWFIFYNSITAVGSQNSNAIPYAGFEVDAVQTVLEDFYSMLNNKELKLIDRSDALSWLNEGVSVMKTKLNLSNREYTATAETSLSIVADTQEYTLPTDFSKLIYIKTNEDIDEGGYVIDFISLRDVPEYLGSGTQDTRYYLRGLKIGFVPTPTTSTTFKYRYLTKASRLTLNSDILDMPDNGAYIIKDLMLYRAHQKLMNHQVAAGYKASYEDGLNKLIASLVDRDGHLDCIGLAPEANV
jgi:hypothetical protein